MIKLIPHPLMSLAMLAMWMLLTDFTLGQLLLGVAVSLFAGWALGSLQPRGPKLGKWWKIFPLMAVVSYDILRSNIQVAQIILRGPRTDDLGSGFLTVPLRMRNPMALAVLALIVTATPGSVWMNFDPETGELLLHVAERGDTDWVTLIRDRYEAALLEIFA